MIAKENQELVNQVRRVAVRLNEPQDAYDPLLELIGDARFVLIGEASHGTHEFYQSRGEITKRLIQEKGFNTIAVEADWPDRPTASSTSPAISPPNITSDENCFRGICRSSPKAVE